MSFDKRRVFNAIVSIGVILSCSFQPAVGEPTESEWNEADSLLKHGKLEEALTKYSLIIKSNPNNAEAYEKFGITLGELKRYQDAIDALNYSLSLKANERVYRALAELYSKTGQADKAKEALSKVEASLKSTEEDDDHTNDLKAAGIEALDLYYEGKYDQAYELAKKGMGAQEPNCLTALGAVLLKREPRRGIAFIRLAANEYEFSPAQSILGDCFFVGIHVKKDYRTAQHWYLKAAAKNEIGALFNLGYIFENGLGIKVDKSKAKELFTLSKKYSKAYIEKYPHRAFGYTVLMNSLSFLGDQEAAAAVGKKGLQVAPRDLGLIDTYVRLLMMHGHEKEAFEYAKNKFKNSVSPKEFANLLLDTTRKAGKERQAVNLFKKALKAHPKDYLLNLNLAHIYSSMKNHKKSIYYAKKAVEINGTVDAYSILGYGYMRLKQVNEAESVYLKAFAINKNWESYVNLGNVYATRGQFNKSITMYREALKLNPKSVGIKKNLDMAKKMLEYEESKVR